MTDPPTTKNGATLADNPDYRSSDPPEISKSILPDQGEPVNPEQAHFFETLVGPSKGYLFIWLVNRTIGQRGSAIGLYPDRLPTAIGVIEQYAETHDIYFCAQLLEDPNYRVFGTDGKMHGPRVKENVVERLSFLWADLDSCHPDKLLVTPSIVVESSPDRWQAYWLLIEPIDKYDAERLCQRIAYWHKDDGCDSGWPLTKLLRVPGTPNHKYLDKPTVEIRRLSEDRYTVADFDVYDELPQSEAAANDEALELPDFAPLPHADNKYFWSFFNQVKDEPPNKGARGPGGEDRSRSGRTHWLEQRCAEIGLVPGQIRTAAYEYLPAKDKESDEPGWIDRDFINWLRDEWRSSKMPNCNYSGSWGSW
jgi:hypothetical protein